MTAEPIGDAALAEVVRLAEGATGGPWSRGLGLAHPIGSVIADGNVICRTDEANAAFIAAANPATVLAMRARITAAEAECQHGMALIGELTARAESAEAERDRLRAALQTGINAMDIYCRDLLAAGESKLAREWRGRLLAARAALAGADR